MLIIIGKTASGKTTVVNELCKRGYKQLVTYTTRPRRHRESKNTYHFISNEDFEKKCADGFFAEYHSYNTTEGIWHYGSAKEDYENADDKTIAILDPFGYYAVLNSLNIPIKAIYLYASIPTIYERLKKRGDNKYEIERRIDSDNQDFRGLEMQVDRIVYNGLDCMIEDVVQRIIDYDQGGTKSK